MRTGEGYIPLYRRFGVRTFVALVSLPVIAVIVTAVSLSVFSSATMRQNVSQRNFEIARRASEEIQLYLEDSFNYLESLADILLPVKDPWVADIILESAASSYGKFKNIHLLGDYDDVRASTELDNSRSDYKRELLVDMVASGTTQFSELFLYNDGLPYISVALSVDAMVGPWPAIYADLRLRDIWDLVDDISFGESGKAVLVSSENVLIAHPDKTRVLSVGTDTFPGPDPPSPEGGFYVSEDDSGVRYLVASDEVPVLGWRIVIVQLLSEALVPIQTILFNSGIITFFVFAAAIGVSILLVSRYSGPLNRLMRGTEIIREGALSHRIHVDTDDEFGRLSLSFNSMVTDLEDWSRRLAESEKKHRLLTENVNDIIFSLNADGFIQYCSNRVTSVTGYSIEDLCGTDVACYLTESSVKDAKEYLRSVRSEFSLQVDMRTLSGGLVALEAKLVRTEDAETGVTFYGVARDITERKKAEARLAAYQNELRSLASQLTLTEVRERKKIATLLHDRIAQALSLSRIKLGILNSYDLPGNGGKMVSEIIPVIEQIIKETRSLIFTISSPLLYDLGLSAALEALVEQFGDEHSMTFRYTGPPARPEIDIDMALLLFDAVKELLVNTVKHSNAGDVTVSMRILSDCVDILVKDDGVGFDVSAAPKRNGGGYGLFSIKERFSNLGGSCDVVSGNGSGASIRLQLPAQGRIKVEN